MADAEGSSVNLWAKNASVGSLSASALSVITAYITPQNRSLGFYETHLFEFDCLEVLGPKTGAPNNRSNAVALREVNIQLRDGI